MSGAGTHKSHFQQPSLELQKLLHKHSHKGRKRLSNFIGITGYTLLVLFNLNSTARDMRGRGQISSRLVATDRTQRATPLCKIKIAANTEFYRGMTEGSSVMYLIWVHPNSITLFSKEVNRVPKYAHLRAESGPEVNYLNDANLKFKTYIKGKPNCSVILLNPGIKKRIQF